MIDNGFDYIGIFESI